MKRMRFWQCALLLVVYCVARFPTWRRLDPDLNFMIQEARVFEKYGFLERGGVLIDCHWLFGQVNRPELHNYPNHSPLPYWAVWAARRAVEDWFIVGVTALTGLVSLAMVIMVGRQAGFTPDQRFLAGLLFTASPTLAIYDPLLELMAPSVLVQTLGTYLLLKASKQRTDASPTRFLILLGLCLSLDWIGAFTGVGWLAFLWMRRRTSTLRGWWRVVLLVLGLAVVAYAAYVVLTMSSSQILRSYVMKQTGLIYDPSSSALPPMRRPLAVLLKCTFLIGPFCFFGGVLAVFATIRSFRLHRNLPMLQEIALWQVFAWSLFCILFSQHVAAEIWPYGYVVMPLCFLIVGCFGSWFYPKSPWRRLLIGVLIVSLLFQLSFLWLRGSVKGEVRGTLQVAEFLRQHTSAKDRILTNLSCTTDNLPIDEFLLVSKADRYVQFGVKDWEGTAKVQTEVDGELMYLVATHAAAAEVPPSQGAVLVARRAVQPDAIPDTVANRLQRAYWRLRGAPVLLPSKLGDAVAEYTVSIYRATK